MNDFILNNKHWLTISLEFTATLSCYLLYNKSRDYRLRLFLYYLLLTVVIETLACYTYIIYSTNDNALYESIKNTVFRKNSWLYNIYLIAGIMLLMSYFSSLFKTSKFKKAAFYLYLAFLIFSVLSYVITETFFRFISIYSFLAGSIFIFISVSLYYYELLNSEQILKFYKSVHFYVVTTLLMWYICIAPLMIFTSFFNLKNPNFIAFHDMVMTYSNIIMYLTFTVCFITFYSKTKKS